jgi:hypothetical protein
MFGKKKMCQTATQNCIRDQHLEINQTQEKNGKRYNVAVIEEDRLV